ncbi:hypothetical protein AB1Y20_020108 [Prymnesium parvum]|uniref:Uncharacterized protein n=1 Tax=Prymnesium parvum TaxID=97485 RepID=A0AB34JX09_PRYPA
MAAKRPWWHEIVAGLSTERTPAPPPVGATGGPGQLTRPVISDFGGEASRPPRSPGAVLRRRISEWDPGSPAMEWVRRATFDGRALAIRRAQDAHRRRSSLDLGIAPILVDQTSAPRRVSAPAASRRRRRTSSSVAFCRSCRAPSSTPERTRARTRTHGGSHGACHSPAHHSATSRRR